MFHQFDKDGGGSIDTSEIRAILDSIGRQSQIHCLNCGLYIILDLFIGLHPEDDELEAMISDVDSDNTGSVEFSEFVLLWKSIALAYKRKNRLVQLRRRSTDQ